MFYHSLYGDTHEVARAADESAGSAGEAAAFKPPGKGVPKAARKLRGL